MMHLLGGVRDSTVFVESPLQRSGAWFLVFWDLMCIGVSTFVYMGMIRRESTRRTLAIVCVCVVEGLLLLVILRRLVYAFHSGSVRCVRNGKWQLSSMGFCLLTIPIFLYSTVLWVAFHDQWYDRDTIMLVVTMFLAKVFNVIASKRHERLTRVFFDSMDSTIRSAVECESFHTEDGSMMTEGMLLRDGVPHDDDGSICLSDGQY